jgi:hypothetical protein
MWFINSAKCLCSFFSFCSHLFPGVLMDSPKWYIAYFNINNVILSAIDSFLSFLWYRGLNSGLLLCRWVLCHLSHVPDPFCFSCLCSRILLFAWGLPEPRFSYLLFPCIWDEVHATRPSLFCWDGVWAWTLILRISASWVVGLTSKSHWALLESLC